MTIQTLATTGPLDRGLALGRSLGLEDTLVIGGSAHHPYLYGTFCGVAL